MKFVELKKNINEDIKPAYLIMGADAFLKSSAIEIIKNKVVTGATELNSAMFSTDKLEVEKVVDACNTMPFFSDKKLVLVKEYEKKRSDALISKLETYLLKANENTCLVLVAEENSKYFVPLINKLEVVDCGYLSKEMLKRWILNKLKELKKEISVVAMELLIDYCNYDLNRISMELYKLVALVGEKQTIEKDNVDANVYKDLEFQVYELTNALSLGDANNSLLILKTLLEHKSTTSAIIATIYKHFRRLFYSSISDINNSELATKLEVKEYAIVKARQQAKRFGARKLKDINELIVQMDYKSKIGKMDGEKAVNYLVLSILNM